MPKIASTILVFLSILWADCLLAQVPRFPAATTTPDSKFVTPKSIEDLPPHIRQQLPEEYRKAESLQDLPPHIQQKISERIEPGRTDVEGAPQLERFRELPERRAEEFLPRLEEDRDRTALQRPEQFSRIEIQYRTGYASALSANLRQFGYEIFEQTIPKPSRLAVPSEDYVLGPGDRIRIRVWGSNLDTEFSGEVDRSGNIDVPNIGVLPVAGVPFGQLEALIRREAEKYIQGINLHVSLVELRSLEIYVVGAVDKPGLHLVPAFSTVLDALLQGGPVRRSGSLRSIALYRDGVLHGEIDLYQLLLKGDREADIRLQNRDVIFVPRIGPTAAITGAFAEEGIYELKDEQTVGQLIDLAGGILPQGFAGRIHLRRYTNNREFVIKDIDTKRERNWQVTRIEDGDLLEVQFVLSNMPSVIRLMGHVRMPDVFRYQPGLSLRDVLKSPDILQPGAVTDHAILHRYDPKTARYSMSKFPLSEVFQGRYNQALKPYDRIEILSMGGLGIQETVTLSGAVTNPGTLEYRPGLTLRDVLISPDILKPGAVTDHALLHRYDREQIQFTVSRFPLQSVFDGTYNLPLLPEDRIEILARTELEFKEDVTVAGAVMNPGTFTYFPGQTLADIMALAGDTLFGARTDRIELSRNIFERNEVVTRHSTLDLQIDGDFLLQPYDYIFVPKVKDAELKRTVTISGEVRFPGTYRISQNERLSDLIQRAGGMTPDAYYFGAKYTSAESRRMQKQAHEDLINELELRSQTVLYEQAQAGLKEDAAAAEVGMATMRNLINRLRAIEPEGRVAIVLADLDAFKGSVYDFELENGDTLHIPKRPNFVAVNGSVFSPSSYLYEANKTPAYYLAKAGGPTKTADRKHIYVLRANGEVVSAAQSGRFGGGFNSLVLMPGDQVVVPEDLERVPHMRKVRDITDILFKIMTSAGVVIAIL